MGITDKQRFLSALDEDLVLPFARIFDISQKSFERGYDLYGDFLSENALLILKSRARLLPCEPVFFGGYDGAERCMIGFCPDYITPTFPISALEVTYRKTAQLSHRDFLGAVMGLGIKREKCGDIIVDDGKCLMFMQNDIARFVESSLLQVGREGVSVKITEPLKIRTPEKKYVEIKGTVSAMRLDCVLVLMLGQGRSRCVEWIESGKVFVNGVCALKSDMHIKEGDILSVRKSGRASVELGGTSKKGRIFVTLKKSV